MEIVALLVLALANWRLSSLVVNEEGPSNILSNIRYRIGVRYDEYSHPYGKNVVASALTCVWCTSVWVGLFEVIITLVAPQASVFIFLPFALSAAGIIINKFVDGSAYY